VAHGLVFGVRRQYERELLDHAGTDDTAEVEPEAKFSLGAMSMVGNAPDFFDFVVEVLVQDPPLSGHVIHRDETVMAHEHEGFFLTEAIVKPYVVLDFDLSDFLPVVIYLCDFTHLDYVG